MQFDSQVLDQFAFEGDATITGEHQHLADVALTKLKSLDDEENNIEYKQKKIRFN